MIKEIQSLTWQAPTPIQDIAKLIQLPLSLLFNIVSYSPILFPFPSSLAYSISTILTSLANTMLSHPCLPPDTMMMSYRQPSYLPKFDNFSFSASLLIFSWIHINLSIKHPPLLWISTNRLTPLKVWGIQMQCELSLQCGSCEFTTEWNVSIYFFTLLINCLPFHFLQWYLLQMVQEFKCISSFRPWCPPSISLNVVILWPLSTLPNFHYHGLQMYINIHTITYC